MKICKKCGKAEKNYYGSKCFYCNKPHPQRAEVMNLFEAMYYVEEHEDGFNKETFFDIVSDWIYGNDSYSSLGFIIGSVKESEEDGVPADPSLKLFLKHFPDVDDYLWHISW